MSIRQQTRPFQRPEPLRLDLGQTADIIVEQGDDAELLALHSTNPKRRCTGAGCKLCAAEVGKSEWWIANVYHQNALRQLWLRRSEFAALGAVLPGDAGQAVVRVTCESQHDAKTGEVKVGASGRPYTQLRFELVRELVDDLGEAVDVGRV